VRYGLAPIAATGAATDARTGRYKPSRRQVHTTSPSRERPESARACAVYRPTFKSVLPPSRRSGSNSFFNANRCNLPDRRLDWFKRGDMKFTKFIFPACLAILAAAGFFLFPRRRGVKKRAAPKPIQPTLSPQQAKEQSWRGTSNAG